MKGPAEPIVTYAVAVAIFYITTKVHLKIVLQPFKFFGDISYALHLMHYRAGILTLNALCKVRVPLPLTIAGGIAASILAATLVTRYVEKPAQRLGRPQNITVPGIDTMARPRP